MIQPAVHDPPRQRKRDDDRYADQNKEFAAQLVEQLHFRCAQHFAYSHLTHPRRAGEHHQHPKPHTGNENRQYGKESNDQTEDLILAVLLVEELIQEEIVVAGIREITVPYLFRLFHQLAGLAFSITTEI